MTHHGTTALTHRPAEVVDPATGEILPAPAYDARAYLAGLASGDGLRTQQALAAAYDAAVAGLIGPNDVQEAQGRSFKKKSAWRKLARHFSISVSIVGVETRELAGHFLAIVTARAVAPWGQSYEEVGACCTDEAVGQRTITAADAIATASTRASNRAVSNLIAMGEVSAEEVNGRGDRPAPRRTSGPPPASSAAPSASRMPFGKTKGTPLAELSSNEISNALAWAESKDKFHEFQEAARAVLAEREGGAPRRDSGPVEAEPTAASEDFAPLGDDDLPF